MAFKTTKDCTTCVHLDITMAVLFQVALCDFYGVGLGMRGYKPCDEYKDRREGNYNDKERKN